MGGAGGALRVMYRGCSPPVLKAVFHFLSQNIVLLPTEVAAPPKVNAMTQAATHLTIRPKFSLSCTAVVRGAEDATETSDEVCVGLA